MDLSLDPQLFLLDLFPNHLLTTEQCYMPHILLKIARKMITSTEWSPVLTLWLQKVRRVNDRILDSLATVNKQVD